MLSILAALLAVLAGFAGGHPQSAQIDPVAYHYAAPSAAPASLGESWGVTNTVEITGTVSTVTGTLVTLTDGVTVTLAANAKVKGMLQPNADVLIVGQPQPDGSILAFEIEVGGASGEPDEDTDLDGHGHWITATLGITDGLGLGSDRGITCTQTITPGLGIGDHWQGITGTRTITDPDGIGDAHMSITGTWHSNDAFKPGAGQGNSPRGPGFFNTFSFNANPNPGKGNGSGGSSDKSGNGNFGGSPKGGGKGKGNSGRH